ncbi:hypothetical protein BJ742DRAFT_801581 [Cladochytrium replicatum]|nr:hypothetical protein BJ742DRAFT_801581 [Cladochytrium replicatum]
MLRQGKRYTESSFSHPSHQRIDPNRYLMSMFFVINTALVTLYIGKPDKPIITKAYNLSFLISSAGHSFPKRTILYQGYAAWMALPTVAGVIVCFLASPVYFEKVCFRSITHIVDISGPIPASFRVKAYRRIDIELRPSIVMRSTLLRCYIRPWNLGTF